MKTDPQLLEEIHDVLSRAAKGRGLVPQFLTSYQILDRLPAGRRDALISAHGAPGQGAKTHYAAASAIAEHLKRMPEVEVIYLDTKGLAFDVAGTQVRAGYGLCGLYRLRQSDPEVA